MKRVVVLADFHCGHVVGLTPPQHNERSERTKASAAVRSVYWDWFAGELKSLGPIDLLIANGDLIDGKGEKSGGTEQLTADREVQAEMAADVIKFCKPRNVTITYGTSYHTGRDEDWEKVVADEVGARKIGSHDYIEIAGLVFDTKHHIGGSQIPHGRYTAIARERLWNQLWAERGDYPKADVIIRSHVHYFAFAGGPGWLGIVTPALQGAGSKYGTRIPSGVVDFGFLSFEVRSREDYQWRVHLLEPKSMSQAAVRI